MKLTMERYVEQMSYAEIKARAESELHDGNPLYLRTQALIILRLLEEVRTRKERIVH